MITWTNKLIKNQYGEVYVEFTSSQNHVFTKKYKTEYTDTFLQEKLDFQIAKQTTFDTIKSMLNSVDTIRQGWTYKFTYADMQSDFIEIFVEIFTPWQSFNKMFNVITVNSLQSLSDYVANEKLKINTMIDNVDLQGLENYFGEVVSLDGSNIE